LAPRNPNYRQTTSISGSGEEASALRRTRGTPLDANVTFMEGKMKKSATLISLVLLFAPTLVKAQWTVYDPINYANAVVWKVEGISQEQAEALQKAMAREFGGDQAATDCTRVLRLPGFANKKYDQDYYVQVDAETDRTYQLRDFTIQLDSPEAPRHRDEDHERGRPLSATVNSQSEHDWAFAKRALVRGDEPEEVIRRIADFRAGEKHDPLDYARRTVIKAQAELNARVQKPNAAPVESSELEHGH
jgi:hypothetical protein